MDKQVKKHILVVDDEQSIRDLIKDILEEEGHIVSTAANGLIALGLISSQGPFDLIISDIRMPIMGGVKLLELVKEKNPNPPPIIFITGYADIGKEEACNKGAIAYLKKPMSITELVSIVNETLEHPFKPPREHFRLQIKLDVIVKFKMLGDTRMARTLNISSGGMFVFIDDLPNTVGQFVTFELVLDEIKNEKLVGVGEVIWQRTEAQEKNLPGVGIQFLNLSFEDEERLKKFIQNRRPVS